jgi:GTP cyclohydrolase II
VIELASAMLKTKFGTFKEILYSDGSKNIIVLTKGNIEYQENVLCRIHSHCISAHYFHSIECDCNQQMEFSQKIIEEKQQGIIIWLEQEGRGNGHYAKMLAEQYKKEGQSQAEAYIKAGYPSDNRQYFEVKTILEDLKVKSVVLISNSDSKRNSIERIGVKVNDMIG